MRGSVRPQGKQIQNLAEELRKKVPATETEKKTTESEIVLSGSPSGDGVGASVENVLVTPGREKDQPKGSQCT